MNIGKTSYVHPYNLLNINNKCLTACVYTGNADTLIKPKVLRNMLESYKYRRDERTPELIALNGTKLPTTRTFYKREFLGDRECLIPCIEVEDEFFFEGDMLSGLNFIGSEGLKFDFEKYIVKLDGSRYIKTNYKKQ